MKGSDKATLAVTLAAAVLVPLSARAYVGHRLAHTLEPTLASATGESVEVGDVYVGLSGSVTFSEVNLIGIARAEAIDASVSLSSLLAGRLSPDELRVTDPSLSLRLYGNNDSNLARVLRRVAAHRASRSEAGSPGERRDARLRRIVVDGGSVRIRIEDRGELWVEAFELIPTPTGVRAVLGRSHLRATAGPLAIAGSFARAGLDLDIERAEFTRILAVGGEFEVQAAQSPEQRLTLVDAHLRRGLEDGDLRFSAAVHQVGQPGEVALRLGDGVDGESPRLTVEVARAPLDWFTPVRGFGVIPADTFATGSASFGFDRSGLALTFDLALEHLVVDHRAVAAEAFEVSPSFRGELHVAKTPAGHDAVIKDARVVVGDLQLTADGSVSLGKASLVPESMVMTLAVAEVECQRALESLPAPLAGPLAGMALSGSIHAAVQVAFDRKDPDQANLQIDIPADGCRVLSEPALADVRALDAPVTQRLADGGTRTLDRQASDYAVLERIPAFVSNGFVAAEDARFFEHHGFDGRQILRSLLVNVAEQELVRGGSTISQQLVKNLYLTRRRTVSRKLVEAVLTWRLEAVQGKKLILERYLNLLELGPHIYGVAAASEHWFGVSPQRLSVKQAAFLMAMTPEPTSMSRRVMAAGGLDERSRHRVEVILRALRRARVISAPELERAQAEPLTLMPTKLARNGE